VWDSLKIEDLIDQGSGSHELLAKAISNTAVFDFIIAQNQPRKHYR
jgi:hypothetical protein